MYNKQKRGVIMLTQKEFHALCAEGPVLLDGATGSNLMKAGIEIFPGVMGEADMVVEDFIAGILEYDPNARCNHHSHEHTCGEHDCGNHEHHGDCHCHDE